MKTIPSLHVTDKYRPQSNSPLRLVKKDKKMENIAKMMKARGYETEDGVHYTLAEGHPLAEDTSFQEWRSATVKVVVENDKVRKDQFEAVVEEKTNLIIVASDFTPSCIPDPKLVEIIRSTHFIVDVASVGPKVLCYFIPPKFERSVFVDIGASSRAEETKGESPDFGVPVVFNYNWIASLKEEPLGKDVIDERLSFLNCLVVSEVSLCQHNKDWMKLPEMKCEDPLSVYYGFRPGQTILCVSALSVSVHRVTRMNT
jgi:hypothetical protein